MEEQLTSLGKYQIIKRLGQGATSTVYLGYDPFTGREVAIKLLKPEILNDPKTSGVHRKQLHTEASLAGKLSHPHIVAIYDAVIEPGDSYIVMEYVGGGTLEKFASPDHLLPISRVIEYMFKCCRALNYAQFHGVIHRDIKPANILLTQDGDIKISDMGAAIVLDVDQTQISDIGSPVFMSPEQINGEPLTHQTDIYSLGVVMYCLLTGRLPFTSKNLAGLFYQILNSECTPLKSVRPDISEKLEHIVARAMQKDRNARYQNWKEFGYDLAEAGRLATQSEQSDQAATEAEKFTILREMGVFAEFTDTELWEILRIGEWKRYPAQTQLIREDEFGDDFYILVDGTVGVTKGKRLLNVIQKGDSFGEMAYISGRPVPRSATVTSNSDVIIMRISPQLLLKTSDHCQLHFNQAFLRIMADRLRTADDRFAKLVS